MQTFFAAHPEFELVQVLLTSSDLSPEYASKVLRLFDQMFECAEHYSEEPAVTQLCSSIAKLAEIPSSQLDNWLSHLGCGTL